MATAQPPSPALHPDRDAIEAFYREVIGSNVHLVSIIPDGETNGRHFESDFAAAADWSVAENRAGRNVYWTVNQVRLGVNRKCKKADILSARFLHADFDPPKGGGAFDIDAIAANLADYRYPPSFTLMSGGGLQAFWRLSEPIIDQRSVEEVNRRLAKLFTGGDHCHNIDRLMRVPATINYPNAKKAADGRVPVLARTLAADDGMEYPFHALTFQTAQDAPKVEPEPPSTPAEPVAVPEDCTLLTSDALFLGPLDPLRSLIDHPQGRDRSGDALACAGKMVRDGYTDEQIFGVLMNPANPVNAHIRDHRDPRYQALRCIEKAREDQAAKQAAVTVEQRDAEQITARPWVWVDPADIPLRPWVFGRWLLRGVVTAAVAPGGVGKSTLLSGTALSLATGSSLLGKSVWEGRKRVWIWNLEDQMDELNRSLAAAAKHFEIERDDIDGWLHVNTAMDGDVLCTAVEDDAGFRLISPIFEAITAELIRLGIDVLIIDPFVSSHEVDENANSKIDKIAKAWSRVAVAANCSIVLVHHTSKAGSGEVTALSARGAKALTDACRSVLVLNRMENEVAERFGFDEAERRRYFHVSDDKHNRAPPEKSDWFRLASVDLGNAGPLATGDSVGVAAPWSAPDPFEGLTGTHLLRVQQAIDGGDWRENHQAETWVGKVVASVLGLNADDKADKRRIMQLIKTWLSEGALAIVTRPDSKRMDRKFVEVGKWQFDNSAPPSTGEALHGGAVRQNPCHTTTPPYSGGVGRGAAGQKSQVGQGTGGAEIYPHGNPALKPRVVFGEDGRINRAPILAPGESLADPVPGFD